MKKVLILLLPAAIWWGCKDNEPAQVKSETTEEATHHHEAETTTLQLNNGAKWKSDSSTNAQVKLMTERMEQYDEANASLATYNDLGNNLKADLDNLVKQCRMQGADHDALHLWLQPVLEKTKELSTAADEKTAASAKTSLQEQLHIYPQYFE